MINIYGYDLDTKILINFLIPIFTALIVYMLGLNAYFKQKEYENVRARYLENGVELVASQIDYVLGVFRHNSAMMLRITREYRELESQVSVDEFLAKFREVEQDKFQLGPIYKTWTLLNDDVLWRAYQSVFAFVSTTNDKIKSDFSGALNEILNSSGTINKAGFLEEAENFAIGITSDVEKFYPILNYLHQISEALEKGKYSFKEIHSLHKTKEFLEIINNLNQSFPKEEIATE